MCHAEQVHASRAEWAPSEKSYWRAAEGERDTVYAAMAWFGAGVAAAEEQVSA